ncbi:MAG: DUF4143 domain-containing protein [Bacteroidales bacterium]|nr:DUF4143 domain-containing protein [Bacteroidales bacterium]
MGGLPGLSVFGIEDERHIRDYLQSVYNTVMMKDVIERHRVRNVPFINNLTAYIADNIGKNFSAKSIAKFLKARDGKDAASDITISTYLSHLAAALIISPVYRFDVHGKQLLEQNYKYYFADHGLRNFLNDFDIRGSIEKIMENVVRHHLLVQDFKVTVGQLRAGEIDFVAKRGEQRIYIQVTYLLSSPDAIKREFGNLAEIKDNYPKYVISMDPISGSISEYPGIHHLHLREFLKLQL